MFVGSARGPAGLLLALSNCSGRRGEIGRELATAMFDNEISPLGRGRRARELARARWRAGRLRGATCRQFDSTPTIGLLEAGASEFLFGSYPPGPPPPSPRRVQGPLESTHSQGQFISSD